MHGGARSCALAILTKESVEQTRFPSLGCRKSSAAGCAGCAPFLGGAAGGGHGAPPAARGITQESPTGRPEYETMLSLLPRHITDLILYPLFK